MVRDNFYKGKRKLKEQIFKALSIDPKMIQFLGGSISDDNTWDGESDYTRITKLEIWVKNDLIRKWWILVWEALLGLYFLSYCFVVLVVVRCWKWFLSWGGEERRRGDDWREFQREISKRVIELERGTNHRTPSPPPRPNPPPSSICEFHGPPLHEPPTTPPQSSATSSVNKRETQPCSFQWFVLPTTSWHRTRTSLDRRSVQLLRAARFRPGFVTWLLVQSELVRALSAFFFFFLVT